MTMAGREARMLDAVYRAYGRAAQWTPIGGGDVLTPVVRHEVRDEGLNLGQTEVVTRTNLIFVRTSDFPQASPPERGSRVEVTRDAGGADSFRLAGEPRLEPGALEWLCEVEPIG